MYTSVNRQKVSKLSANFEERMEAMRKKDDVLEIGVLNLMHDKEDTKRRFERVLTREDCRVNLTWFYPVMHYQDREVPENVRQMSQPLDLNKVKELDAFIVTGAPLEKLDFDDVTYISELQELFDCLSTEGIEQLYVCWGAMVAANYFYGVDKYLLNQKLFGVYSQFRNFPLFRCPRPIIFFWLRQEKNDRRSCFRILNMVEMHLIKNIIANCRLILKMRPYWQKQPIIMMIPSK